MRTKMMGHAPLLIKMMLWIRRVRDSDSECAAIRLGKAENAGDESQTTRISRPVCQPLP